MFLKAEVFYDVNYVNINYSVKNSTADHKYLLYFLRVSRCFSICYIGIFCTVLVLILRKDLLEIVNICNQQLNNWCIHNWSCRKPRLFLFQFYFHNQNWNMNLKTTIMSKNETLLLQTHLFLGVKFPGISESSSPGCRLHFGLWSLKMTENFLYTYYCHCTELKNCYGNHSQIVNIGTNKVSLI